jgi:molecular chaperone GrpE (heat shock protein)
MRLKITMLATVLVVIAVVFLVLGPWGEGAVPVSETPEGPAVEAEEGPSAEAEEGPAVEAEEGPSAEAEEEPAAEAEEESAVEAEEEPAAEAEEESAVPVGIQTIFIMALALALMAVTTLVAVWTARRQYQLRRVLLGDHKVVFPEHLAESLDGLRGESGQVREIVEHMVAIMSGYVGQSESQARDLQQSFLTLQGNLDERDKEISRLRRGYDQAILSSFLQRFLRVEDAMSGVLAESAVERSDVEALRELLDDALAETGLESFSPKIGEEYGSAIGVGDRPKQRRTLDQSQHRRILEVTKPGYRVSTPDGYRVVREARVVVGVFEQDEEQEDV